MHIAILSPPSKGLPLIVEQDTEKTPQQDQTPIRHDRRNIPIGNNPLGNELAESITPHILVDRDGDEQTARNRLVAVDCICGYDTRESGDLDASAGVADQDDGFPGPVVLVAHADDDVAEVHDDNVGDHCWETHLGFTDTTVTFGGSSGDPIGQGTGGCQANHSTDKDSEVCEACKTKLVLLLCNYRKLLPMLWLLQR